MPCVSDRLPWGKWDVSLPDPYPVLAHLLDTAAVALTLWRDVLSMPVRDRLAAQCVSDPCAAGSVFAMVAGGHALGKYGPLHQGQLLTRRRDEFAAFLAVLDLPVPEAGWLERAGAAAAGTAVRAYLRHEALGGHILDRGGAAPWLCAAVSGHHG